MKTGSAAVTGKGKKRLNGFLRFVRTVIILALILGITGGIAVAAVNIAVIGTAKKTILTPDEAEKLEGVDCIIVLGCQVKKDVPSDMLYDRIVTGVDLYRLRAFDLRQHIPRRKAVRLQKGSDSDSRVSPLPRGVHRKENGA